MLMCAGLRGQRGIETAAKTTPSHARLLLTDPQTSQTSNTSILGPSQGGAEKSLQLTSWIRPTVSFGFCFCIAVRLQSACVIGSVMQETQRHVSTENPQSM